MKKLLTFVAISALAAASSFADTFKIPKDSPIAAITFPSSGWKVEAEDESINANTEDDAIYINVEFNDADSLEGAIEETFGFLKKNKVTIDKSTEKKTEANFHGMAVVDFSWSGQDSEGKANISLTVLAVSEKKALLMLYWASPEGEAKHKAELNGILQSIKSLVK